MNKTEIKDIWSHLIKVLVVGLIVFVLGLTLTLRGSHANNSSAIGMIMMVAGSVTMLTAFYKGWLFNSFLKKNKPQ